MPTEPRSSYLGLQFDNMTLAQALDWVHGRASTAPPSSVVTPNVDHLVRLDRAGDDALSQAYLTADLCLCDSRVLAALARLQNVHLNVVPGSDLTSRLLASMPAGSRVAIVGGDETCLAELEAMFPETDFSQHRPPMGLRTNKAAMDATVAWAIDSAANYIFLAVGSPQSELLADRIRQNRAQSGVVLCIGASIDFITCRQHRAPQILQRLALEWLWRLATDPKRLARRYLIDGPRILRIALRGRIAWK